MTITRQAVVDEARAWIGTPWHHQAAVKGVGSDCIGLLLGVAGALGLVEAGDSILHDERLRSYGREPLPHLLLAACDDYMNHIPIAAAGLGDVLLLRVPRGQYPQHFGIASELGADGFPSRMIHSTAASPRQVVENRIDAHWRARILRAYTLRGVA